MLLRMLEAEGTMVVLFQVNEYKEMKSLLFLSIHRESDYSSIIRLVTPVIGANKSYKLTHPIAPV